MNGEHWRDYFDSAYLGAWDLPPDRDCVVTISRVEKGTLTGLKGKSDKKALVFFKGKDKALAANKTNAKTIASMHGPNPLEWVGKQIAMYVAKNVDTPNGPVDAIRIRPRIPQPAVSNGKGRAAPPTETEIPPNEPPMGALETDHEPS